MVPVYRFEQFGCDLLVGLCPSLQPFTIIEKHFDRIDDARLFVEFLDHGGELGEFVAEPVEILVVLTFEGFFE